jgi:hypothetical protein
LAYAGVKPICALLDAIAEIQRRILRYLVEHRFAKDTVAGITQWWLRDSRPPPSLPEVEEALEGLVQKGWLAKTRTSSLQAFDKQRLHVAEKQQHLYGLKESRLAEIEEFLRC